MERLCWVLKEEAEKDGELARVGEAGGLRLSVVLFFFFYLWCGRVWTGTSRLETGGKAAGL